MTNIAANSYPTLLKLTLFHGCFSLFLSCTNVTKPRNPSHDRDLRHERVKAEMKLVLRKKTFTMKESLISLYALKLTLNKAFARLTMDKVSNCDLRALIHYSFFRVYEGRWNSLALSVLSVGKKNQIRFLCLYSFFGVGLTFQA